jgi:hypothetical protein
VRTNDLSTYGVTAAESARLNDLLVAVVNGSQQAMDEGTMDQAAPTA